MNSTYSVQQNAFGKATEYRLVNGTNGSFVSVIPEVGAVLNQLGLFANQQVHELCLSSSSYEDLLGDGITWYKGSKLLPFPNRIDRGKYDFNGKSYTLPINEPARDTALHGLVFNKPWTVVSSSADEKGAKLVTRFEDNGTHEGYPFKYTADFIFELNEKGFTATTRLTNNDNKDLPIGDGIHPYFRTGTTVDNWRLKLPKCQLLEVGDNRLIPTGKTEPFTKYEEIKVFGDQKFDACFVYDTSAVKDGIATLEIEDPEKGVKFTIWQEVGENKYNYLQIYTPDDRKSLAIEPMTCAPNTFNNGLGLIVLKPGQTVEFAWGANLTDLAK